MDEVSPLRKALVVGGPVAVAAGAALWGTDALFRLPLTGEHSAITIVFAEHVVLTLCVAALLPRVIPAVRRAPWSVVLALLVIGAGASAGATMLFTQAFTYGDPITPLLLQKLQPLFAVAAAWFLLGERPRRAYAPLLLVGVLGAYLLAFANPLSVSVSQLVPALLAIGAAALWALGTVLGRYATRTLSPSDVLTGRIVIGLVTSGVLVAATSASFTLPLAAVPGLIGLALVPGLLALTVYYQGLRRTPAMIATLCELAFPLTAALLGRLVLGEALTLSQWAGVALLVATVVVPAVPPERLPWRRGRDHAGERTSQPELVTTR